MDFSLIVLEVEGALEKSELFPSTYLSTIETQMQWHTYWEHPDISVHPCHTA